jgi:hypothetical protein
MLLSEIWRYLYISFSRRSQTQFRVSFLSLMHLLSQPVRQITGQHEIEVTCLASHARANTIFWVSFASEGGLSWAANPNTTAHKTPHKTHNKNKFLPCNENVHGIFPPLHTLQPSIGLPTEKLSSMGRPFSWASATEAATFRELSVSGLTR